MKSMLLTKLKATGWGLLLAASITVGAVALTYRPAAAQPANGGQPAARTANPDELEALRLEVEALRLELKVTKERVKALEDHQAQAMGRNGRAVVDLDSDGPDRFLWEAGPNPASGAWTMLQQARPGVWNVVRPVPSPEDVKQLAAEVEAAAKKLREKPDDKQALEELNCAVERLRKAKEQKSDP